VFPGNVKMALDAQRSRRESSRAKVVRTGTLLRLPLQWPMIRIALRAARS
jgi:hypothetical protein